METVKIAWEAKLYAAVRKVDMLGSSQKQKVSPNIEDLHMLLEEMSDRVQKLKTECPSDWGPMKKDIETGSVDMRGKYEETMDFIGKTSPVSNPE